MAGLAASTFMVLKTFAETMTPLFKLLLLPVRILAAFLLKALANGGVFDILGKFAQKVNNLLSGTNTDGTAKNPFEAVADAIAGTILALIPIIAVGQIPAALKFLFEKIAATILGQEVITEMGIGMSAVIEGIRVFFMEDMAVGIGVIGGGIAGIVGGIATLLGEIVLPILAAVGIAEYISGIIQAASDSIQHIKDAFADSANPNKWAIVDEDVVTFNNRALANASVDFSKLLSQLGMDDISKKVAAMTKSVSDSTTATTSQTIVLKTSTSALDDAIAKIQKLGDAADTVATKVTQANSSTENSAGAYGAISSKMTPNAPLIDPNTGQLAILGGVAAYSGQVPRPYNPLTGKYDGPLPQAATGGYVGESGVAVIHKGETITPAGQGSSNVHIHVGNLAVRSDNDIDMIARALDKRAQFRLRGRYSYGVQG